MSPAARIIILCTFPGILAGILQILLLKKSGKTESMYRIIICYIGLFYGILSLVKMILDSGKKLWRKVLRTLSRQLICTI